MNKVTLKVDGILGPLSIKAIILDHGVPISENVIALLVVGLDLPSC
jgi:hypothetical protein